MVQPILGWNRSQSEWARYKLHLAVGFISATQLASRQTSYYAELQFPDRRILRQSARHGRTRSSKLQAQLRIYGDHESVAENEPASMQLSLEYIARPQHVQLSLYPKSSNRVVPL